MTRRTIAPALTVVTLTALVVLLLVSPLPAVAAEDAGTTTDTGASTSDGVGTEEAPAEGTAEGGEAEGGPADGEGEGAAGGEEAPLEFETPAVSIVDEPEAEIVQPWTIRYLVPTTIAVAGLLVFGTVVQYFLKVVRARYKTVE